MVSYVMPCRQIKTMLPAVVACSCACKMLPAVELSLKSESGIHGLSLFFFANCFILRFHFIICIYLFNLDIGTGWIKMSFWSMICKTALKMLNNFAILKALTGVYCKIVWNSIFWLVWLVSVYSNNESYHMKRKGAALWPSPSPPSGSWVKGNCSPSQHVILSEIAVL